MHRHCRWPTGDREDRRRGDHQAGDQSRHQPPFSPAVRSDRRPCLSRCADRRNEVTRLRRRLRSQLTANQATLALLDTVLFRWMVKDPGDPVTWVTPHVVPGNVAVDGGQNQARRHQRDPALHARRMTGRHGQDQSCLPGSSCWPGPTSRPSLFGPERMADRRRTNPAQPPARIHPHESASPKRCPVPPPFRGRNWSALIID
jgi:hypothetical protein